jgi:hypothetical protein
VTGTSCRISVTRRGDRSRLPASGCQPAVPGPRSPIPDHQSLLSRILPRNRYFAAQNSAVRAAPADPAQKDPGSRADGAASRGAEPDGRCTDRNGPRAGKAGHHEHQARWPGTPISSNQSCTRRSCSAAFRTSGEALSLREIAARSGLPKSMVFRQLYTLERCGMLDKAGENLYRSHLRPFKPEAVSGSGMPRKGPSINSRRRSRSGCSGPRRQEGLEIICVDNRYSPKIALRNADVLVRERVDLVVEFQTDEQVARDQWRPSTVTPTFR